jgi:hypothetical protein
MCIEIGAYTSTHYRPRVGSKLVQAYASASFACGDASKAHVAATRAYRRKPLSGDHGLSWKFRTQYLDVSSYHR